MEKLYKKNHVNHIKQGGKSWKRDPPCFRITDLILFNRPLSTYNHKG